MSGRLYLIPNTLDFGAPEVSGVSGGPNATAVATGVGPPDLHEVLPLGVIRLAARMHFWVAENAKTTRAFLKRVDAVVPLAEPLQSLQIVELPRPAKGGASNASSTAASTKALEALLAPCREGHDVGLISEAGLPAVADPGAAVVEAAHAQGIVVVALSGPSSLMLALAASGLNGQSFAFVGYLPIDTGQRAARIRELETLSRRAGQTQLMIETPYRNDALLGALVGTLDPSTRLSVSCGLTLTGGWTRTDTVARWRARPSPVPKDIPAVFGLLAG